MKISTLDFTSIKTTWSLLIKLKSILPQNTQYNHRVGYV
jgi:hypothetical protein